MRISAVLDGILLGDVVVGDERFEAVINSVTAFLSGNFHEADYLFDLSFSETGLNPGVDAKGLGGKDASIGIGSWEKPLANDCFENIRKLRGDLHLLVGGEKIHDTLHRLRGVDCVKGADHEVPGFGCGHCNLHRLAIAEFAYDNYVGILTHTLTKSE